MLKHLDETVNSVPGLPAQVVSIIETGHAFVCVAIAATPYGCAQYTAGKKVQK